MCVCGCVYVSECVCLSVHFTLQLEELTFDVILFRGSQQRYLTPSHVIIKGRKNPSNNDTHTHTRVRSLARILSLFLFCKILSYLHNRDIVTQ